MKQCSILGKPYSIVYQKELEANGAMGATNRDMQVINVSEHAGIEQQEDTLLHETIHVIDIELKLGLKEEAVARLACALYSAGCRIKVENKK